MLFNYPARVRSRGNVIILICDCSLVYIRLCTRLSISLQRDLYAPHSVADLGFGCVCVWGGGGGGGGGGLAIEVQTTPTATTPI